jgi:predicted nucleic acid-binding protein
MAEKYLIDTSAVIKYLSETFPVADLSFLDKTLIADNDKDFSRIPELKYINPKNLC